MFATMLSTFQRIFGSRKAVFTLLAMAVIAAYGWTGRVTGVQALDFMKWVLGIWLVAQGVEDTAMHLKGSHPGNAPPPTPAPESKPGLLVESGDSVPPSGP